MEAENSDASGEAGAAGSSGGTGTIISGRERIDEIDRAILDLVARRIATSQTIQQARIASGGRRVDLAREMEVISRYEDAYGRSGTQIAMALLDVSKAYLGS